MSVKVHEHRLSNALLLGHRHTPIVSSRPSSVSQGVQRYVLIVARLELVHVHHLACSTSTLDPEVQRVIRSFGYKRSLEGRAKLGFTNWYLPVYSPTIQDSSRLCLEPLVVVFLHS